MKVRCPKCGSDDVLEYVYSGDKSGMVTLLWCVCDYIWSPGLPENLGWERIKNE